LISVALGISSCKRADVADQSWDGPATFNILVEGSANPAVLLVDGLQHISRITVHITDSKGNPLAGRTLLFQQADAVFNWIEVGFFENYQATIRKTSDANGIVTATFFLPADTDFAGIDAQMYIRVLLVVVGRSDSFSLPQDYISLLLMHAN
jgi:hypothetical protein